MLLEAIDKIENRDKDILSLFYDRNTFTLRNCNSYDLISGGKKLLSGAVKEFVRFHFTEKDIKTEYLDPLLKFLKDCRPLDIFSTNYDVCIELLCKRNKKKCVTGFNPTWNPQVFNESDMDIRLYKLHGSATWYKTGGEYESSNLLIKGTKFELVTRETAVPFIIYPGKKLQYDEPTIDMSNLKNSSKMLNTFLLSDIRLRMNI
jgi:SIR2-like domain